MQTLAQPRDVSQQFIGPTPKNTPEMTEQIQIAFAGYFVYLVAKAS